MLAFLAGLLLGGVMGVFVMCLCAAAGNADRGMERTEQDRRE